MSDWTARNARALLKDFQRHGLASDVTFRRFHGEDLRGQVFDADDVRIDDEVVLIGRQGAVAVTADDWAAWLETITYEVVSTVGARVPRVYTERDV